jgi:hypothetical protein
MMERFLSGVPWLARDKHTITIGKPTPRGIRVRVN